MEPSKETYFIVFFFFNNSIISIEIWSTGYGYKTITETSNPKKTGIKIKT